MMGGRKYTGIIFTFSLMVFCWQDSVQAKPFSFTGIGTYQHDEDDGDESQITQSTTFDFDQSLTPTMTVGETLRYTSTLKKGGDTEAITPSLDYQIINELFYFDLSGTWNKLRNSERADVTNSNWEGRWISNWQKELWPVVQMNYGGRSSKDDESQKLLDTETTFSGFNVDWDLLVAKVYYNVDLNETDDFAADSNTKSVNQLARLTTDKNFMQDRLNVAFLGQYNKNTQNFETQFDADGTALINIAGIDARGIAWNQTGFGNGGLPEWTDDFDSPGFASVEAHQDYDIAIDLTASGEDVDAVYVETATDLYEDGINPAGIDWQVYYSNDGEIWSGPVTTKKQVYNSIYQRFEIDFDKINARYILLRAANISPIEEFVVTAVRAYSEETGGEAGKKIRRKNDYYKYLGDTSVRYRIAPDLNWSYNLVMEDGETGIGEDIDRTYNATSLNWSPALEFSSSLSTSEQLAQFGDEDEEKTRNYSWSFASMLLPTLDVNGGITRSDEYEADEKTDTSYIYNAYVTALIFPDLTSNLDLSYIDDHDEEEDVTTHDFNSILKFTTRVNQQTTIDLTEKYNTSNDEDEADWYTASLVGVNWRPSDILSLQVGGGKEWEDESSDNTYYLTVALAPTYKTQLNLSYDRAEGDDDYSASYHWTINHIFSMRTYCSYIEFAEPEEDEDDTSFVFGAQLVIRY